MSTIEVLHTLKAIRKYKAIYLTPTEDEAIGRAIKHFQILVDRQKGGKD